MIKPERTTASFAARAGIVPAAAMACLLLAGVPAFAQIEIEPVAGKSPAAGARSHSQGRIQSLTPISLPFWDDFSQQGPGWPDSTLWIHSNSVFISNGIGIDIPSINVAVFDGVDSLGTAYSPNEPTLNGFTDKLISYKILTDEVPAAERNSVYLSFFYEWAALGEPPDDNDYLQVDFRRSDSVWVSQLRIYGDEIDDPSTFNTAMIPVTGDEFFHENFQFRIRSYGRKSGAYDTWVLDCIYLNKGRDGVSTSFPDRAIASDMTPFYGRYHAMPYMHFLLDKKLDTLRFDVYQLRDDTPAAISYDIVNTFTNYVGDTPSTFSVTYPGTNPDQGFNIDPLERVRVRQDILPDINDPLQFNPDADSVDVLIKMRLNSDDEDDITRPSFFNPPDFRVNDTLSRLYPLRNYYAYDDGVAEYTVLLTQAGDELAYRFTMPIDTASLAGFYIHFPYSGGSATETMDLLVYGDDNGRPSAEPLMSLLSRTIRKKNNNGFMLVKIVPSLFINDSVFYIGYRQPTSQTIKLGLDKNNDTGDRIFYSSGAGGWQQNSLIQGSLMIRPVIVKGNGVVSGLPGETPEDPALAVFPNPNSGTFFMPAGITHLHITDVTGRAAGWTAEETNAEHTRITLTPPATGMYLVRWANGNGVYTAKMVVK